MTQPSRTSSASHAPRHSYGTERSGVSASAVDSSARKSLRGQAPEERIFDEVFRRVIDGDNVDPAVRDRINEDYSADPSAFMQRLLANTSVPKAPLRSSLRSITRALRVTMLVFGFVLVLILTVVAIVAIVVPTVETGWKLSFPAISIAGWILVIRGIKTGRLFLSETSPQLNELQDAEAQYRDSIRVQLTEYSNVVANSLYAESIAAEEEARRRAAEESAEVVLATTEAPRLVELDARDPVPVKTLRDVQEFIQLHVTSAIGISGPRGIGKTTIMRLLCSRHQDHYVGVYVPAPVKYSPADFVRTIHQRTAEEILEAHGASRQALLTQRNGALTVQKVVALAILVCAAAGFLIEGDKFSKISWPIATGSGLAAAAAALVIIVGISHFNTMRDQRLRDKSPLSLARTELEKLAWSTKTQMSSKNSMAWKGLSHEDSNMTELVERETSHMQRVDAFQKFAALYRKVGKRTVIVAVDELDKISDPDEAIGVVNGLKDLMHGEGIHFLVSVSEDALARFALRGIPLRDAFDSTFDTIAEVDRFSVEDARILLERRVVGMPQVLAYYCHALSGGIPRDLIRFCRQCVDVGRQTHTSAPTCAVITTVTRDHATGLLNGAAIRAKQDRSDSLRSLLEVRDAVRNTSDDSLFELLDRAATYLWDERVPDRLDLVPALPLVLAIMSTAGCYFGRRWTAASWRAEAESGTAVRITNSAAGCIADASVDTTVAVQRLAALREELRLAPLGMAISS
jgi:Cdc6-like AAA superfamily ATPase